MIAESPIEFARFADVVKHEHAARHVALTVSNRRRRALDIKLVAVAANQQCRADGFDRAIAANRHGQRILERLAGFFMESAEDLVDGPAARVVDFPSRQLFRDGIDVFRVTLRVRGNNAVANRL